MRNSFKIVCSLLFISLQVSAQTASNKYSLKQCVDNAITNNLQVKQSDLQMQTSYINKKQAISNVFPYLVGSFDQGINQGRSIDPFTNTYINQQVNYSNYNLSAGITLFNGLRLQNNIRENVLAYEAGKMELQQTKEAITLHVILAYLQVLNNEDLVVQARNQQNVSRQQVERLTKLDSAGAVSPSQYHDVKGQWSADKLLVVDNENALSNAKLALAQLMNVPYGRNMQVERLSAEEFIAADTSNADEIYNTASQLSIIKAVDLRQRSAEKKVAATRGQYFPRVSLTGNLTTNYSSAATKDIALNSFQSPTGDFVTLNGTDYPVIKVSTNYQTEKIDYNSQFKNNYNTSINLNVRIPIFNSLQNRHAVALSKIELKNSEYISENTRNQLRQSIEQAHQNMQAAYKRYQTLTEQVKDFEDSYRAAEIKFNAGATNSVDYLIAKNNVDRAKSNLIIARYDFVLRSKILDYYRGKLSL